MITRFVRTLRLCSVSALLLIACNESKPSAPDAGSDAGLVRMSREELMDPETCRTCHPNQYREWKSSMHAYAAQDPVFLAMNKRGQRETNHQLGDFCVKCHAPMAVREKATTDGLNLAQVDPKLQGVTCYFCHSAVGYGEPHNNSLELQEDGVMRGPLRAEDLVDPGVHGVAYSAAHNPTRSESSALCGSCHDVVAPAGGHIERTFAEFQQTLFAVPGPGSLSCQACHMRPYADLMPIAVMKGVDLPKRKAHGHLWAGVDVALDRDFPDQALQEAAVLCELEQSLSVKELHALDPLGRRFELLLETAAGHSQPSGSAQDRRMWVEAIGYDSAGKVVFETGNIADDEVEEHPQGSPDFDPQLAMLRDHMYGADGREVHMFWEAASTQKDPLLLKGQPADLSHPTRTFVYSLPVPPARFTLRVRMRPVGMDVLKSLVDSGDLDPAVLAEMPTFTLAEATWRAGDGARMVPFALPTSRCPDAYECQLYPDSSHCKR